MGDTFQLRRGPSAEWASKNTVLAQGEAGFALDTKVFKIGDGVTPWNTLAGQTLTPSFGAVTLQGLPADPAPPAAGSLLLYAKSSANRLLPKIIGPSGLDTALQPLLAKNKIGMLQGHASPTPAYLGAYYTVALTGSGVARAVATTNLFTRTRRMGITSAATAGSLAGVRVAANHITTGGSVGAGFYKLTRFGFSDAAVVAGARSFIGVALSSAAPTNVEPATLTNAIGVGHGAADANLMIYWGGSAAQTPIDLGPNFPANTANTDLYELALFAPPDTADVHWEVKRLNTGHSAAGTLPNGGGASLPSPTTLITYLQAWRSNNATAAAVGLDIVSDYIETDY